MAQIRLYTREVFLGRITTRLPTSPRLERVRQNGMPMARVALENTHTRETAPISAIGSGNWRTLAGIGVGARWEVVARPTSAIAALPRRAGALPKSLSPVQMSTRLGGELAQIGLYTRGGFLGRIATRPPTSLGPGRGDKTECQRRGQCRPRNTHACNELRDAIRSGSWRTFGGTGLAKRWRLEPRARYCGSASVKGCGTELRFQRAQSHSPEEHQGRG